MSRPNATVELCISTEDASNIVSGLYAFMPSCTNELIADLINLILYIDDCARLDS